MASPSGSVTLLSVTVVISLRGALHLPKEHLSNTSNEEIILHNIGKSV